MEEGGWRQELKLPQKENASMHESGIANKNRIANPINRNGTNQKSRDTLSDESECTSLKNPIR